MEKINLQSKTSAKQGEIEAHWRENEHTGLRRTLFHKIQIPLVPFDSGLDYESQPVETAITIDWLDLKLSDPYEPDNVKIEGNGIERAEASIYIGYRHNPCDIVALSVFRKKSDIYCVKGEIVVDFEHEMVAQNEEFSFETEADFLGIREPFEG